MKIKEKIRLIELFAGYGSQALALEYLGIPFEHHFVCEFDKHACQSYNEIHGTNFETSDVNNITAEDLNIVETDKYKYLLTYSFPCTDLSLAGKRAGMARDSGTRSSLLWQVERLLKECGDNKPQYLMMENVPQVIGAANIGFFKEWCEFLVSLGYKNYYKVMNAEDYGVPQHRERVIMVSILDGENNHFEFPKPTKLNKTFEDLMEKGPVDPKYYLSSTTIERIKNWKSYQNPLDHIITPKSPRTPTVTAALGTNGNNSGMILLDDKPTVVPTLTISGNPSMNAGMQLVFDNHEIVDVGSSEKFWTDHQGDTSVPTLKTNAYLGVVEKDSDSGTYWYPSHTTLFTPEGNVRASTESDDVQELHPGQVVDLQFAGTDKSRVSDIAPTLTFKGADQFATKDVSWTPSETDLITEDANVKTYTHSDEVQHFGDGQVADLSFPGGYGHGGGRIYDSAPTLTATSSRSLATKEPTIKGAWSDKLIEEGAVEPGDVAQITFGEPKVIKNSGVMQTITTRPDCFGVCVDDSDVREFVSDYNKDAPHQQDMLQYAGDSCRTIPAGTHGSTPHHLKTIYHGDDGLLRIRKLTPRECFRLMGVRDEDYEKLTTSDQQKYKQAGNSIVVDVLMAVFDNLFVKECKKKSLF